MSDIIAVYTIPQWMGFANKEIMFRSNSISDDKVTLNYSDAYYLYHGITQMRFNLVIKKECAFFGVSDHNDTKGVMVYINRLGVHLGGYNRVSKDLLEKLVPRARELIEPHILSNWIKKITESTEPTNPIKLGDIRCTAEGIIQKNKIIRWENILAFDVDVAYSSVTYLFYDKSKTDVPASPGQLTARSADIAHKESRPYILANDSVWPQILLQMHLKAGGTGPLWVLKQRIM